MSTSVAPLESRRKERPLRIPPDEEEIVRRGRRQLSAELNQDLEDNEVLAQFIRERFDRWVDEVRENVVAEQPEPAKKQTKGTRK